MCLICVELQKDLISTSDARKMLGEMSDQYSDHHNRKLERMIETKEKQDYEVCTTMAPETCTDCDGKGTINLFTSIVPCDKCKGTGTF